MMKTPVDILSKLSALSEADLAWIIGRLSVQSKSRLLAVTSSESAAPVPARPAQTTSSESLDALARMDASTLARVLKHEPAWLLSALVFWLDWPWRSKFMDTLPSVTRNEVERLHSSGQAFTHRLIETLASVVLTRVANQVGPHPISKFEALIARLGTSRAKKRLALHL